MPNIIRGGAAGEVQVMRGSQRGVLLPSLATDLVGNGVVNHGLCAADPNAVGIANGAVISSFPNFGTGGAWSNAGVSSTKPTFVLSAAAFNGRPGLQFVGSSQQRLIPTSYGTLAQDFFVTVICAFTGTTGATEVVVGTGTTSGAAGVGRRGAGDAYNASDAAVLASGIAVNAQPKLITAKFSGGGSYVKVNGVQGFVGNAGSSTMSTPKVGAGGVGTAIANAFTGLVHLVIISRIDHESSVWWPNVVAAVRDCGGTY